MTGENWSPLSVLFIKIVAKEYFKEYFLVKNPVLKGMEMGRLNDYNSSILWLCTKTWLGVNFFPMKKKQTTFG